MAEQKLHKFNFENNRIPKITSAELNRRIKFITPCVVIKDTMPGDQYKTNTRVPLLVKQEKNTYAKRNGLKKQKNLIIKVF